MRKFMNTTEKAFYDYTMSHKPYRKSTVWHYIVRLRQIKSLDRLVLDDLDAHIAAYTTGAYESQNAKSHHAYSCALKCLKDFAQARPITI